MAPTHKLRVKPTGLVDAAGILRVASWAVWDIGADLKGAKAAAVSEEPKLEPVLTGALTQWGLHIDALYKLFDGMSDGVTTSAKVYISKELDVKAWIEEHLGVKPDYFDPTVELPQITGNLQDPTG